MDTEPRIALSNKYIPMSLVTYVEGDDFVRPPNSVGTATGRWVNPMALKADDVCIEDIAVSLSHQCRFGGHCMQFYSVGEHSLNVAGMSTDHATKLLGLLHDATEAYLIDVPRPYKQLIKLQVGDTLMGFYEYEEILIQTILKGLNCQHIYNEQRWAEVMKYDNVALDVELETIKGMFTHDRKHQVSKYKTKYVVPHIYPSGRPPLEIADHFIDTYKRLLTKVS